MNNKTNRKTESGVSIRVEMIRQLTLVLLLAAELIIFAFMTQNFFTTSNMINVLRQVSITGISSLGMFMIILLGDIDLSVGSMYAFIGVISAIVFKTTESTCLTLIVALALGIAIGLFNGIFTAKFRVPAFITTLATMSICRGFAYIITGGSPIGVTNPKFTFLGTGYVFNLIPLPVIFMIIVLILGMILVKHTRFGRYIYSCGGNAQAAKWSEMDVITAVVLGGTSMSGGKGKLWGVVLGVLIIGVLTNGLTMINVSSYWQKVIKGIIILAAVIMDNRNAATN